MNLTKGEQAFILGTLVIIAGVVKCFLWVKSGNGLEAAAMFLIPLLFVGVVLFGCLGVTLDIDLDNIFEAFKQGIKKVKSVYVNRRTP